MEYYGKSWGIEIVIDNHWQITLQIKKNIGAYDQTKLMHQLFHIYICMDIDIYIY